METPQLGFDGDFHLDDYQVQPLTHRICRGDEVARVEPKAMLVLVCLAEAPGQVVTRQELMERVWPDTVVGEEALNNAVAKLRKLFGDTDRSRRFIETVPKAGYRLVARVTPSTPTSPPQPAESRPGRWGWAIGAMAVVALMLVLWLGFRPDQPDQAETRVVSLNAVPSQLTAQPGGKNNPDMAADGALVYAWRNEEAGQWDIYLKRPMEDEPRRLTQDPAPENSPVFSPDGTSIAYQRMSRDGGAVYQLNLTDGIPQKLVDCPNTIYPDLAWSDDGSLMAFNGKLARGEAYGIMLLETDTLIRRKLTDPDPVIWGDHDPAFSPKGRSLAFVRSASEGIQDIYLINPDGGKARRITHDARNIQGLTWSADGKQLIYASNRGGIASLWRIALDGGPPRPLTPLSWGASKPVLDEGGQHLTFVRWEMETNVWRYDLTGKLPPRAVITSQRWDMHPQISTDNGTTAFCSNRDGSYEVWLKQEEGKARKLTHFSGPFTGTPRFSPDGTRLVFDSRPAGHADIYLLNTAGGSPLRLTFHEGDDLAPSFSADGTHIYFGSSRNGSWQVWRVSVAGGTPEQVTRSGGFAGMEDHDGTLYFTRYHHPGIWRRNPKGEAQQLIQDLETDDWGNWAVHNGEITYVSRKQQAICRYYPDGTTTRLMVPEKQVPSRDPAMALSPDGSYLLLGQIEQAQAELWQLGVKR